MGTYNFCDYCFCLSPTQLSCMAGKICFSDVPWTSVLMYLCLLWPPDLQPSSNLSIPHRLHQAQLNSLADFLIYPGGNQLSCLPAIFIYSPITQMLVISRPCSLCVTVIYQPKNSTPWNLFGKQFLSLFTQNQFIQKTQGP